MNPFPPQIPQKRIIGDLLKMSACDNDISGKKIVPLGLERDRSHRGKKRISQRFTGKNDSSGISGFVGSGNLRTEFIAETFRQRRGSEVSGTVTHGNKHRSAEHREKKQSRGAPIRGIGIIEEQIKENRRRTKDEEDSRA
jgi:hypothetical protein